MGSPWMQPLTISTGGVFELACIRMKQECICSMLLSQQPIKIVILHRQNTVLPVIFSDTISVSVFWEVQWWIGCNTYHRPLSLHPISQILLLKVRTATRWQHCPSLGFKQKSNSFPSYFLQKTVSPVAGGGKPSMQGCVEACGEAGGLLLPNSSQLPLHITSALQYTFNQPCA